MTSPALEYRGRRLGPLAALIRDQRWPCTAARVLRRVAPVLELRGTAIVSASADIHECLERDGELSVLRDNGRKMESLGVSFVLGMDPNERHAREKQWLDAAMPAGDLPRLREIVRRRAKELLDAAEERGEIDAATGYARSVAAQLVIEYFGVRGPDLPTLLRWLRSQFWDLFVDLGDTPAVHERALADARAFADAVREQISVLRKQPQLPDTVLGHLLASTRDDDAVRRNISGLVVGAVDTTNTAFARALGQLLRRPQELAAAERAAQDGDVDRVGQYLFEALRFAMHNPILVRNSLQPLQLRSGRKILAQRRVLAFTLAAMFDPEVVADPHAFRSTRVAPNYHFGAGLHRCQGMLINGVVLPELATALLARGGIARVKRRPMTYEGPFPDRLDVKLGASRPRLLAFPPSVDSETARWILRYHRVHFDEERRSAIGSGWTRIREGAAIPILIDRAQRDSGSLAIAAHLDALGREERRLVPADRAGAAQVDAWWQLCHEEIGVWVAQWVYFYVLQDRELALRLMSQGASDRGTALQRPLFPLIAAVMKLGLRGLNAAVAANALQQIREVFARVDKRLESGASHLVGDRLTLADVAFCACAGAVTLSPNYGGAVPKLEEIPDAMRLEVSKLRASRAAVWVESLRAQQLGN